MPLQRLSHAQAPLRAAWLLGLLLAVTLVQQAAALARPPPRRPPPPMLRRPPPTRPSPPPPARRPPPPGKWWKPQRYNAGTCGGLDVGARKSCSQLLGCGTARALQRLPRLAATRSWLSPAPADGSFTRFQYQLSDAGTITYVAGVQGAAGPMMRGATRGLRLACRRVVAAACAQQAAGRVPSSAALPARGVGQQPRRLRIPSPTPHSPLALRLPPQCTQLISTPLKLPSPRCGRGMQQLDLCAISLQAVGKNTGGAVEGREASAALLQERARAARAACCSPQAASIAFCTPRAFLPPAPTSCLHRSATNQAELTTTRQSEGSPLETGAQHSVITCARSGRGVSYSQHVRDHQCCPLPPASRPSHRAPAANACPGSRFAGRPPGRTSAGWTCVTKACAASCRSDCGTAKTLAATASTRVGAQQTGCRGRGAQRCDAARCAAPLAAGLGSSPRGVLRRARVRGVTCSSPCCPHPLQTM